MAYQGLGSGVVEDAFAVRLFSAELPEVMVAVSCSKNFGLYRERTGSLHVVTEAKISAEAVLTQLVRIARSIYSMPPDHGAAIVQEILDNSPLRQMWEDEVAAMRKRIQGLRHEAVQQLRKFCPQRDFGFIEAQRGMFSYLGVTVEQVRELQSRHHVYMTDDSRMNVAGLRRENIEYFAQAVAKVLATR
jgi:aspartate aminotransferase